MRFAFCVYGCIPLPKEASSNNVKRRCTLRLFYKRRLYKKTVPEILLLLLLFHTAVFLLCVMLVFNVLGQKI